MRFLLASLVLFVLLTGASRADDDRSSAIVGIVHGGPPGSRVTVDLRRRLPIQGGGTPGRAPEEGVRTLQVPNEVPFTVEGLEPGLYGLAARRGSTHAGETMLRVHPGARAGANVELAPARTIKGTLVWEDGQPVTGTAAFRTRSPGHAGSGPYDPWDFAREYVPEGATFRVPIVNGTFVAHVPSRIMNVLIETRRGARLLWAERWDARVDTITWRLPVQEGPVLARVLDAAAADGRGFELQVVGTPAPSPPGPRGTIRGRVTTDGKPVAGAVVHAASVESRYDPAPAPSARSQGDGSYVIEQVPSGDMVVFVRGGGWASRRLAEVDTLGADSFRITVTPDAVMEHDLEVERTWTLPGRVVDHEGKALDGATVRAIGVTRVDYSRPGFRTWQAERARVGPFVATTTPRGRFSLSDLVPGHVLSIRVEAPGLPRLDAVLRPGPESNSATLRFARPHHLRVRVIDKATGDAVPGARVMLVGMRRSYPTDAAGEVRFGPVGFETTSLQVQADGYVPRIQLDIPGWDDEAGPPLRVVALARGLEIRGRVEDAKGKPLKQIHVSALHKEDTRSGLGARAVADDEGRFVLRGLFPGTWTLHAQDHRERRGRANVEAAAGAEDVVLRFAKPRVQRELTVRVVDGKGEAIPRAEVRLTDTGGHHVQGGAAKNGILRLTLSDETEKRIQAGGVHVRIQDAADEDGARLPLGWSDPVTLGPLQANVRIVLPEASPLRGRLIDPDGRPVAGARVLLHPPLPKPHVGYARRPQDLVTTDSEGYFVATGLGKGKGLLEIDAGKRYHLRLMEVEEKQEDVVVRLVAAASVRVIVVDPDGVPIPDARVELGTTRAGRRARRDRKDEPPPLSLFAAHREDLRRTTAHDGSALLQRLEARKRYHLTIQARRDDIQRFDLDEWLPESTTVQLERAIVIAGRVVDVNGVPVAGAVVAYEGPRQSGGKRTRQDGSFRIPRLAPGTYRLQAGYEGERNDALSGEQKEISEGTTELILEVPAR